VVFFSDAGKAGGENRKLTGMMASKPQMPLARAVRSIRRITSERTMAKIRPIIPTMGKMSCSKYHAVTFVIPPKSSMTSIATAAPRMMTRGMKRVQ